jgi:chaperonin GroES
MELNVMNVRPLHDRIIVHRLEEGEQQIGGIIIPDTAKEKPQQGTVIAAGHGKANEDGQRVPLDVKAGDQILFGKYAGQDITLDGEKYFIMKEDDVLAIIEGRTKKTLALANYRDISRCDMRTDGRRPERKAWYGPETREN